jgi:predicted RNA binding protein YcfA (HicA-like mRNA interferase family)
MSQLPRISGRECVRALEQVGFHIVRQRGSHVMVRRDDSYAEVVVPDHRELDKGTLCGIIRQVGLSVDEFVSLLGTDSQASGSTIAGIERTMRRQQICQ